MNTLSFTLDPSSSNPDARAAVPSPGASPREPGRFELPVFLGGISDDPAQLAQVLMDGVGVALDELDAALAQGEDHRLAELGTRFKMFSRIASTLGLATLSSILQGLQVRATRVQACELS